MLSEVIVLVCPECETDMTFHQNKKLEVFTCPSCHKRLAIPYNFKAKAKAAGVGATQ